jgi:hypothetical protein
MKTKAAIFSLVFVVIAAAAAALGFVAFPGCATPQDAPRDTFSPRENACGFALRAMEKKKKRGELAGVEPTAAGTFSGTWVWYDDSSDHQHVIRFVFRFADGRPERQFEAVYAKGWRVTPLGRR